MSLGSSPNCIAALFEAAGAWTAVGAEEQKALGSMALQAVNGATNTWSQARFTLNPGDSYSEIPTSFQGSWMSRGKIDSMMNKECQTLWNSYQQDMNSAYSDRRMANSAPDAAAASADSDAAASAEQRAGAVQKMFEQMGGGSDPSEAFFNLMKGLVSGTVSAGELQAITTMDPSYVHHTVTGSATIQQLTDHVRQLLKEKANGQDVQAAQALLGEAQTWQQNQTACANAGVKQAQGYLTAATNEVLSSLNALQGLVAMLKLSQRQLAG